MPKTTNEENSYELMNILAMSGGFSPAEMTVDNRGVRIRNVAVSSYRIKI